MELLHGTMRNYPWGSRTLLADLRGAPSPSPRPEAEIWYGAHPAAPATVDGEPLTSIISEDSRGQLGDQVAAAGSELPFLVKLLAAGEPLSLQAHPSAEQAVEGFQRENAAGLALGAPDRNYRDPHHKPEIIIALTRFEALSGFRPVSRTRELFAELDCPKLNHYTGCLESAGPDGDDSEELRALFTTWITIPTSARIELIEGIVACAQAHLDREDWIGEILRVVCDLNDRYPGDVGVLGAMLLNHITLEPGEAAYTAAGQLHAYLSGLGVEVMANSDNVLRGGLTAKYVDVPELVRVLDFASNVDPRVGQGADGTYQIPASEFHVSRRILEPGETLQVEADGPAIVLCVAGSCAATVAGRSEQLRPTDAAWIPANDGSVSFRAGDHGADVFITRG